MTTYSKETALYDTGKIATDIGTAGQTATKYLTTVSGTTGISVHDVEDESNFVNVNSAGMRVYKGGNEEENIVAEFGETVVLGNQAGGHITIGTSGLSINSVDAQLAAFTDDGITLKTNDGNDALTVSAGGGTVTKTITDNYKTWSQYIYGGDVLENNHSVSWGSTVNRYLKKSSITVKTSTLQRSTETTGTLVSKTLSRPTSSTSSPTTVTIGTTTLKTGVTLTLGLSYSYTYGLKYTWHISNSSGSNYTIPSNLYVYCESVSYSAQVSVPLVETDGTLSVGGDIIVNEVNATTPTLSITDLSVVSSRVKNLTGGVLKLGKWRFVQLVCTVNTSLSANNTWGIVSGFDPPLTSSVCAMAASVQKNYGNVSANIASSGNLVVQTAGTALAANDVLMITGWYISQ